MRSFELYGYERVWLPIFEYARVLERTRSIGSALRFVEPDSGEVMALRADMTPQVARLVSTRYRQAPMPARLCYQGSVLRRRRERARMESQVVQAGIELVGSAGLNADFEVISALCDAVRAAGLTHFVLDIGHAGIASSLTSRFPVEVRGGLNEALSAKDTLVLERRGWDAGLRGPELRALVALADLHGGQELLASGAKQLAETPAASCGEELRSLGEQVLAAGIADQVVFDFGETNRFDYYTGVMFQVLAAGPGEALGSGGRYDNLYPRFGIERPAAGCALDLNNVCRALETANWSERTFPKLVASGSVPPELLAALRRREVACAVTDATVDAYGDAWGFEFRLATEGGASVLTAPDAELSLTVGDTEQQAQQIADFIKQRRQHA